MLSASLTGPEMAAVVSISGANSGLTRDRAKWEEAIMKLKSQPLYRQQDHQCPDVDYYEADLIENKRNGTALEAARTGDFDYVVIFQTKPSGTTVQES